MMNNELYHYGVPGMKWGVRRDTRIIANHRRNVEVGKLKERYRAGKITKQQYKDLIHKINLQKNPLLVIYFCKVNNLMSYHNIIENISIFNESSL